LNSSRQLERIEKQFKKKVQCRRPKQLTLPHCKDKLRTKRRRIRTIKLAEEMPRGRVENAYA
jgi:hypothetical protein